MSDARKRKKSRVIPGVELRATRKIPGQSNRFLSLRPTRRSYKIVLIESMRGSDAGQIERWVGRFSSSLSAEKKGILFLRAGTICSPKTPRSPCPLYWGEGSGGRNSPRLVPKKGGGKGANFFGALDFLLLCLTHSWNLDNRHGLPADPNGYRGGENVLAASHNSTC